MTAYHWPRVAVLPVLALLMTLAGAASVMGQQPRAGAETPRASGQEYNLFETWKIDRRTNKQPSAAETQRAAKPNPTPTVPPTSPAAGVLTVTADELVQRGETRAAVIVYEKARRMDPRAADFARKLAPLYERLDELPRAAALYQEAISVSPRDAELHLALADCLVRQHQSGAAEQAYRAAVTAVPHHARAWNQLGEFLAREQRYPEAFDAFARVHPPASAHLNMAAAFAREGRTSDAKVALERARAADPNDPALRTLFAKAGPDPEAALRLLTQAAPAESAQPALPWENATTTTTPGTSPNVALTAGNTAPTASPVPPVSPTPIQPPVTATPTPASAAGIPNWPEGTSSASTATGAVVPSSATAESAPPSTRFLGPPGTIR